MAATLSLLLPAFLAIGCLLPKSTSGLEIHVKTGDNLYAGTDANVKIRLYDDASHTSETIFLNHIFLNNFVLGSVNIFKVPTRKVRNLDIDADISRVEVWRDDLGFGSDWFVDTIVVSNPTSGSVYIFPVFRWIFANYHYTINHLDTSLPQLDEFPEQREMQLEAKRLAYEYEQKIANGPVQVKTLPIEEEFPFKYKWDITTQRSTLQFRSALRRLLRSGEFESLEDMSSIYDDVFPPPRDMNGWKSDVYFGYQRLAGTNPIMIRLATEIPEKFPVTDSMVSNLLQGLTLNEAIVQKRLFISDYAVMEGIPTLENFVICHPIGLFFENNEGDLVPVAIQLFQTPGPSNPIYTPEDSTMLWRLVKMWYNNADVSYHQSVAHLGNTHLMMEGPIIAAHRALSQSHPVFKLLAPHFLYLIAINDFALEGLVAPGKWIDKAMNTGNLGVRELMRRGNDLWKMDVQGTLPEDLKERGLEDPNVLPTYHFREDALDLYDIVKNYVTSYVNYYYSTNDLLTGDKEVQDWARELVGQRGTQGVGIKGVPGNGQFTSIDQLIQSLTSVIFTSSVVHAAVNFPQYDQYAFPPNYPSLMRGNPPNSKDVTVTENDILKALPNRPQTFDIMTVTTILSTKGTQSLGDFEVQYVYDPEAMEFVHDFRENLQTIGATIKSRNEQRAYKYDYLEPEAIPNSIGI